jgi:hypothetical protein
MATERKRQQQGKAIVIPIAIVLAIVILFLSAHLGDFLTPSRARVCCAPPGHRNGHRKKEIKTKGKQ